MRSWSAVVVSLVAVSCFAVIGCGDGGGGGGSAHATGVIGAAGGTVVVADGSDLDNTDITVPAGALAGDVTIEIWPGADITPPTGVVICGLAVEYRPTTTTFTGAVTLQIRYSEIPAGSTSDDLVVLWRDSAGTVTVLSVTAIDLGNDLVSVQVSELGTFQVGASSGVTANDDTGDVDEDDATGVDVDVVANDVDPESDPLTVTIETQPANGTATNNGDGTVTYTPDADFFGTDTFTYSADDGHGGADTATVTITVTSINDAPTFTGGADPTVLEDAGAQTVPGWAIGISAGAANESSQVLAFAVTNNTNASLFSTQPSIDASTGTLTYTPAAGANGSADVTIELQDDGGTPNGGENTSAADTFTITVTAVNDAPVFTLGSDETVLEDAGAQTVAGFATGISAGPADEAAQTLTFNITGNTNPSLFSAGPAIDETTGELTYTPALDENGFADITVTLSDDGGTANGGSDTSTADTFRITVSPVNDQPTFVGGADDTVAEDAGAQTVAGWATGMDAGATNESGQTLTFYVTGNTNGALFAAGPAVDATSGDLTYTPADDANGSATITIELRDDGGTANGGVDTSASDTFDINVTSVEDVPVIGGTPDTTANSGEVYSWTPTASDGDGDTLTFSVVNEPSWASIDTSTGELSGTPTDTGVDTSTAYPNVTITVTDGDDPVSLAPFTITLYDVTPPGMVSTFTATASSNAVSLSWSNPGATDYAGTLILRRTDGIDPLGPSDGSATVVYDGTGTMVVDMPINNGTECRYAAYTYDEVPNYSGAATAIATPMAGGYDTNFDGDGVVVFSTADSERGYAVVEDASGRIVVAGTINSQLAIWRYNDDGTPDATFGTGGYVTGVGSSAQDLVIDAAGNILVTGIYANDIVVSRYTDAGVLDEGATGFGTDYGDPDSDPDGYTRVDGHGHADEGHAIALDASGRVYVCGVTNADGAINYNMILCRLTAAGLLDTAGFGTNGIVEIDTASSTQDRGNDLVIDASGNVLVTGALYNSDISSIDMAVWRFTSAGVLDVGNFGEDYDAVGGVDGYFRHHNAAGGDSSDIGVGITLDNSGRILVAGQSIYSGTTYICALWRVTAAGALDTTFNGTGYTTFGGTVAQDVAVDTLDRIVTVSYSSTTVRRFTDAGVADPGFDSLPLDNLVAATSADYALDVAVDSNDDVLVTGYGIASAADDMFIVRLSAGGP